MLRSYKYTVRGLVVGVLIVLIGTLALVAHHYSDYDGKCITLGWFGLSSGTTYECSFSEYISRDPRSFTFLLPYFFWWVPVLMLLLPVVTGWWIDRRKIGTRVSSLEGRRMVAVLGTMTLLLAAIAPGSAVWITGVILNPQSLLAFAVQAGVLCLALVAGLWGAVYAGSAVVRVANER